MEHPSERSDVPELVHLVNEFMFSTRKMFGMFGQIQVHATRVTVDELEVSVSTRHEHEGQELGQNVYNAFVNHLRAPLPVSRLKIVYTNPTLGIHGEEHVFHYVPEGAGVGRLPSHVILVEQVADRAREAARERFRAAWARMLMEAEPSDEEAQPPARSAPLAARFGLSFTGHPGSRASRVRSERDRDTAKCISGPLPTAQAEQGI